MFAAFECCCLFIFRLMDLPKQKETEMPSKTKIAETSPQKAWDFLASDQNSVLVDVRTRAEWYFVGGPSLDSVGKPVIRMQWRDFPDKNINSIFAEELASLLGEEYDGTIFFICRSGVRSILAANAVNANAQIHGHEYKCISIASGFEGDLDDDQRRGTLNGWKKFGLPWRQT